MKKLSIKVAPADVKLQGLKTLWLYVKKLVYLLTVWVSNMALKPFTTYQWGHFKIKCQNFRTFYLKWLTRKPKYYIGENNVTI